MVARLTVPAATVYREIPRSPVPLTPAAQSRVTSVDALRGLVMFAMIFVNDIAGVPDVPWWLRHYHDSFQGSGMTFVDLVFPAFLFIVGMSVPLALAPRLARGESRLRLFRHVLVRTLSLLAIGILMVNGDAGFDPARTGWSHTAWASLLFLGSILAFAHLSVPASPGDPANTPRRRKRGIVILALRVLGVAALVWLAVVYRSEQGQPLIRFRAAWPPIAVRTQWYGILGLIGWAYLVAASAYLALGNRRSALLGCAVVLMGLFAAERAGAFDHFWLQRIVGIGGTRGSQASIAVAGTLLATILLTPDTATPAVRVRFIGAFVLVCSAAALLLHRPYGIDKEDATPAWCLWACAITATLWLILYLLGDVWHRSRIVRPLAIAGQNVLLAYLLSQGVPNWLDLAHLGPWYDRLALPMLANAIARSATCALVVLIATALLNRRGFRLKL
jgi:heparan-alpha-glucosaminide N-acetyltransferase